MNASTSSLRHLDGAMNLLLSGDLTGAEAGVREALAADPMDRSAQALLGIIVLAQGRYGEAETTFLSLAELEPEIGSHWINLGNARRGLREFDAALGAFARAAALGEDAADYHLNLGLTHLERGDFAAAQAVLARSRELAPLDAEIRLRYAQASYQLLHNDAASLALADWRSLTPPGALVLAEIGQLLVNLGLGADGAEALDQALADPGADAEVWLIGIETYERLNRIEDASALLARLDGSPPAAGLDEQVLVLRAKLALRSGDAANAERLYGQALLANSDTALKHIELFPLAQALDAAGRYEEAWSTLKSAHASQLEYLRRVAPVLVLSGAPPLAITNHGTDRADVAAWADDAPSLEDSPVFIVAFPRSGTTLLELTLDAHPALQSMDEQPFIQEALEQIQSRGVDYPRGLAKLGRADLAELRASYWRRVAGRVKLRPGARLIDKNPLNILRLPVIRRLFPNAPIVLAVRHPCDVILSCYMQHFRAPEFALLCSSLPGIARGYQRSLDFWSREMPILGGPTLELRYESLVADFEAETRRLLEFLKLAFDERVLQPAEHARRKGYISTPSYAQVVRPVSSASVGRWQHYARHFAPVLPVVEAQLKRFDYSAVVAVEGVSPNSR